MKILFLIASLALTGCTTVYVIEPKPEAKPVDVKQLPIYQNVSPQIQMFHGDNMTPDTRVPYVVPTPMTIPNWNIGGSVVFTTNNLWINGSITNYPGAIPF